MTQTIKRLFGYLASYRSLICYSIFGAAFSVLSTLFAPLLVGKAVDAMPAAGQVDFSLLARFAVLLAGNYLLGNLFLWLLTWLTGRISYKAVHILRGALYDKLHTLPLGFFDRNPHGDTGSRFVNDVDVISDGLLQGFMALLTGVATIIGSVAFMLYIDPSMALVVVLSAPAAYLTARLITKRSQALFARQAQLVGELNGYAQELIEGQKIVRAFHYEERAMKRFSEINAELGQIGERSQFISSLSNPSTRIVNNTAYAIIGVIGGLFAIQGKITIGDVSSFLIYSTIFAKPFNDITNILSQIQAAAASAGRVFHILDMQPEPPDPTQPSKLEHCTGQVEFRDVSFSYTPDQRLIEQFNLTVQPGSRVAIVGSTGAGKTTLVNLLMRFYDVNQGDIYIDGISIQKLTRETLRRQFGMVLQETWLFHGSIRENIAYAKPEATLEEVVQAAKAAGAHGFIRRLDHGYDTIISDDGDNLSQGQKQLLTIARVMLINPPMIILDEATSNIDTYTEQKIQRAFVKMTEGRTCFVIAHRLSTIKNADVILVMDKGQVVESGTHEELLHRGGKYAALYNSQFSGAQSST